MPVSHYISVNIDGKPCEIGKPQDLGLRYTYTLEDPENFENKGGGFALNLQLPATPLNSRIFNAFESPNVVDMTGTDFYRNYRRCTINVNGVDLLTGSALLQSGSHTRIPGMYVVDGYNQNSDWILRGRDLTLWDCVNPASHTFDVATIEASWNDFDSDENHDYVYAPVRYRQPFQFKDPITGQQKGSDDRVSIYMLRPSISIYWMLVRGFRLLGMRLSSQFMETSPYFRRLVMPWTWGDFYDIESQLTEGIKFKVCGLLTSLGIPPSTDPLPGSFFTGPVAETAPWTAWTTEFASGTQYIFSRFSGLDGGWAYFQMTNTNPPFGFDNFTLYSFDETTGTMKYTFNPPPQLIPYIGAVSSLTFGLSLYVAIKTIGGAHCDLQLEIKKNGVFVSANSILPSGAVTGEYPVGGVMSLYPNVKNTVTPTAYNFTVDNVAVGDVLEFRLQHVQGGGAAATLQIMQAGYLNGDPTVLGANPWQYDPTTQRWINVSSSSTDASWQAMFSTLQMTGLQIQLGNAVNLKQYDKFRSYKFLDLLRGLIDMFNWSIQTNPISNTVTIEPTHDYVLPDGTQMPGYFKPQRLDWTNKQDVGKENILQLFSEGVRQYDFSFKGDGADGGLNIFAGRNKGIYLNNKVISPLNNSNSDNGIVSAIPGASRYLLPNRFQIGVQTNTNRFFSAVMHYKHASWNNIWELNGGLPADNITPQLICIIPENINDSSASAIKETFEPKIACYAGKQAINAVGGWRWIGDPAAPYVDGGVPNAIGFQLPYMFAVDYTGYVGTAPGTMAPILSYSDQNINGVVKPGLMKTYFLKRLAIRQGGKLYKAWMRLTLGDIIDWEHRNSIIIDGAIYHLIRIENFNPLSDDSCVCTLWKEEYPTTGDLSNCFPSSTSILTSPLSLPQFDLKYAKMLLFQSDLPQVL